MLSTTCKTVGYYRLHKAAHNILRKNDILAAFQITEFKLNTAAGDSIIGFAAIYHRKLKVDTLAKLASALNVPITVFFENGVDNDKGI